MVGIAVEECPWIFNIHSPSYVLRHSWYKNGKSHSISGNYKKYLGIDAEARGTYRKAENRPDYAILFYALGLLVIIAAPAMAITYLRKRRS